MLFPTFTFAVFFLVVYAVHQVLRTRLAIWKLFMVAASYVFYGWWNWRFCGLIAGSTLINWLFARAIDDARGARRRQLTRAAVVANLALLGVFKYYDFFIITAYNDSGGRIDLPLLALALPVGIS
ncbi:MAG: hypothetical protein R2706_18995, partial [Acidimicrobiales bacterium]